MKYRVEVETRAKREFLDLPEEVQERLGEVIDDLRVNARPPGAKRLVGNSGYRVRRATIEYCTPWMTERT